MNSVATQVCRSGDGGIGGGQDFTRGTNHVDTGGPGGTTDVYPGGPLMSNIVGPRGDQIL